MLIYEGMLRLAMMAVYRNIKTSPDDIIDILATKPRKIYCTLYVLVSCGLRL